MARLPHDFWKGQAMGARPGAARIDPFLISGWGFLSQNLGSRKESSDMPNQAWMQRWGCSRVRGWPTVGRIDPVGG